LKILFLGIDALDCDLIEKFKDHLPNITKLRENHTFRNVKSTFPPDSDTAWASIVTGLNPAQHGIVHFVDPLEKTFQIQNIGSNNLALVGKTFWDVLGRNGYKTITLFPHLGYPIWDNPGIVVARGTTEVNVQASPASILKKYPSPDYLFGVRGFPDKGTRGLYKYAEKLKAQALADAEFGLKVLREEPWDLFFIYWSTIDAIGHFFWSYFDKNYPEYKQGNPLENVILDTYKLYDAIIGRFLSEVDDEVTVIVLSDHGHGSRPFNLVNVNEILMQAGYLKTKDLKKQPHLAIYEKFKRVAVKSVSQLGLAKLAGRFLRYFPGIKDNLTKPSNIDWENTVAYATDQSGIKAYSYGGIIINKDIIDNAEYESIRLDIISLLRKACVNLDGSPLIEFLERREDVYSGKYLDKFPDILLEFKYGYGLGWAINVPLFSEADSKNLVPGSHKGDSGTFIIRCPNKISEDPVDLFDIAPFIYDFFSIPIEDNLEGKSIFIS